MPAFFAEAGHASFHFSSLLCTNLLQAIKPNILFLQQIACGTLVAGSDEQAQRKKTMPARMRRLMRRNGL
jgi:hypothetical protein